MMITVALATAANSTIRHDNAAYLHGMHFNLLYADDCAVEAALLDTLNTEAKVSWR